MYISPLEKITHLLSDDIVFQRIESLLQCYLPNYQKEYDSYHKALEALQQHCSNHVALLKAYRSAIVSDGLFAFQKGMEANLSHYQHPYQQDFSRLDFSDMYQEHIMMYQSKRNQAETIYYPIEKEFLSDTGEWVEAVQSYFTFLEVTVPKMMHYLGYLFGNVWYELTIPGYRADFALTTGYSIQVQDYLGTSRKFVQRNTSLIPQ